MEKNVNVTYKESHENLISMPDKIGGFICHFDGST